MKRLIAIGLSLLIPSSGWAGISDALVAIGKSTRPPGARAESTALQNNRITDGLRIFADVDALSLKDESIDFELGFEWSMDGLVWNPIVSVGHDGTRAMKPIKENPTLPDPLPPNVTLNINEVDRLKAMGAQIRAFVRVIPSDNRIRSAVSLGAWVETDSSTTRTATLASGTHHSVAFDAAGAGATGTGTSTSFTHVCTGSELVLHAGLSWDSAGSKTDTATYNSVSMVRIAQLVAQQSTSHFRLVAPASGSHSLAMAWSGSLEFEATSMSFTGVDQTTPDTGTPLTNEAATGTTTTTDVTSATGDMVVDVVCVNNGTAAGVTPGAGQNSAEQGGIGATNFTGLSYEPGGATVTMSWSWTTGSTRNAHSSINIKASGGGAAADAGVPKMRTLELRSE